MKSQTAEQPFVSAANLDGEERGQIGNFGGFFGRVVSVFGLFRLQRLVTGWSAIAPQVALTTTATVVVGLAAQQADHVDLIRSQNVCLLIPGRAW